MAAGATISGASSGNWRWLGSLGGSTRRSDGVHDLVRLLPHLPFREPEHLPACGSKCCVLSLVGLVVKESRMEPVTVDLHDDLVFLIHKVDATQPLDGAPEISLANEPSNSSFAHDLHEARLKAGLWCNEIRWSGSGELAKQDSPSPASLSKRLDGASECPAGEKSPGPQRVDRALDFLGVDGARGSQ